MRVCGLHGRAFLGADTLQTVQALPKHLGPTCSRHGQIRSARQHAAADRPARSTGPRRFLDTDETDHTTTCHPLTTQPKEPTMLDADTLTTEMHRLRLKRIAAHAATARAVTERQTATVLADPILACWFGILTAGAVDGGPEHCPLSADSYTEVPASTLRQHFDQSCGIRADFAQIMKAVRGWVHPGDFSQSRKQVSPGLRVRSYILGPLPDLRRAFTESTGIAFPTPAPTPTKDA